MPLSVSKHILNAIERNETSIGEHPALPPDDETKFLTKIVEQEFGYQTSAANVDDINKVKNELPSLLTSCKKSEDNSREALENLCIETINKIMPIPEDTLNIEACLVNQVEGNKERMMPEETSDFSFDSINDMKYLTDEIYKRRMLNCLINGASTMYVFNVKYFLEDLYRINPELPFLYDKIMRYNEILLYTEKDSISTEEYTDAGCVNLYIETQMNKVRLHSEGIIFPVLLAETIKGLLELAISHGLPEDLKKAEYVLKKADFKLADNWDLRLGIPLWNRIEKVFEALDIKVEEVGLNFFFMQLSMLEPYDFNNFLQEVFLGTKEGIKMLSKMVDGIIANKEKDEFDDYMNTMNNNQHQITDSDYFEPDELIIDSENYFS